MFLHMSVILFTGRGLPHPPGQTPPRAVHAGIWSTSGRYASYWNAILLIFPFESNTIFLSYFEIILTTVVTLKSLLPPANEVHSGYRSGRYSSYRSAYLLTIAVVDLWECTRLPPPTDSIFFNFI